jgi:hypothetical protein
LAKDSARARVSVICKNSREREKEWRPRVSSAAGGFFIADQGRRPSSPASRRRRWIERQAELHRAVYLLEVEDDDGSKRYRGWAAELGYWAGLTGYDGWAAARLVFLFFFYFISFILFPVFCFAISNTSLLFYFAGFELAIHLQHLEFEIS